MSESTERGSLFSVVAVGCIECGVGTEVVGVYTTIELAEAAKVAYLSGGDSWARHGGDGYVEIYDSIIDKPWTEDAE